jgi:hypothetical protein
MLARMRKPPRLATLVLGFVLIVGAIWRLFTCAAAPPSGLSALLATGAPSGSPAPGPPGSARARPKERPARVELVSASASPDAAAALGVLEGRVVAGDSGKGIGGARLLLAHEGAVSEVVCGADGAFRFAPPSAGTYVVARASAEGFFPFAPEWGRSPFAWTARPGARVSGFVLALEREAPFTITVKGPDAKPVAGADVRVLGPSDHAAAASPLVTDAQGEAHGPLHADAILEARHPSYAPGRTRVTPAAAASHAITIRLRSKGDSTFAGEGAAIEGRVLDAGGAPASGARVAARFAEIPSLAGADLHAPGADVTKADGTFRIEGLEPGLYDLVATAEDHAPGRADGVKAGATGVVLRLGVSGAIAGTVRDPGGAPLAAFAVVVTLQRGSLEREPAATRSFLDAEGRYRIEGLGPGSYEVVAAALDAAPSAPVIVQIADPPGPLVTADLTVGKGARLRGTVSDAESHAPIEGARIALEGALGRDSDVPLLATATSSADGSFELRGLAPGARSLTVTAAGHHGRIVSGIVVADADPAPIAVELTPTKTGEEPGIELVGIGAVLSPKDDGLVIGQVIAGGGAAEAGLLPGDAVLAIDGVKVTDIGFEAAIGKIRGPEGSVVVLTVRRAATSEVADIAVPRRRIKG